MFSFHVASGGDDHLILIHDLRALRSPLHSIPAHTSLVSDVRYVKCDSLVDLNSPVSLSGWLLVSASFDGTAKIWSADDWKMLKTLKGHEGRVTSVDMSNGNFDLIQRWSMD